jgi:hypothetical protein
MSSSDKRGPWYLLTGLIIGIILGVLYTRYIQPVEYIDTSPAMLRPDFKDQYRAMIAAAYSSNGDLLRARARLELLKDPDIFRSLSEQAQRDLAQNSSSTEARSLGLLAIALGQAPPGPSLAVTRVAETATSISTLVTPVDFNTPASDLSIDSTVTASISQETISSPDGPFTLLKREEICDQNLPAPLIQVQVLDRFNNPVSGVLLIITWLNGEERFYTGLKPERGLGYADFSLDPNQIYSFRVGEGGEPEADITALECESAAGDRFWGAWLLTFVQP